MAWTTAAYRARRKTVTRRSWTAEYASSFRRGERLQVYDKSPRFHGRRIGEIRLVEFPYLEDIAQAPDEDYEAEGFAFLEEHPHLIGKSSPWPVISWDTWLTWKRTGGELWVVRFETIWIDEELTPEAAQGRLPL